MPAITIRNFFRFCFGHFFFLRLIFGFLVTPFTVFWYTPQTFFRSDVAAAITWNDYRPSGESSYPKSADTEIPDRRYKSICIWTRSPAANYWMQLQANIGQHKFHGTKRRQKCKRYWQYRSLNANVTASESVKQKQKPSRTTWLIQLLLVDFAVLLLFFWGKGVPECGTKAPQNTKHKTTITIITAKHSLINKHIKCWHKNTVKQERATFEAVQVEMEVEEVPLYLLVKILKCF